MLTAHSTADLGGSMLDRAFVGHTSAPIEYDVEKGHVRHFADALGDPDPVYRDENAARAAGHPAIPAPPTFPTALRPNDPREGLKIDFRRLLHGEQSFTYARPLYVGDVVTVTARIVDIYEKQGRSGPMDFVVVEVQGCGPDGQLIYSGRSTSVVRP